MPEDLVSQRNAWLSGEAAVLTTLHLSQLLDGYTPGVFDFTRTQIEELNGLSFAEAREKHYPENLLIFNAIGIGLSTELGENTALPKLLSSDQTKHFEAFTYFGNPQLVQQEYIGTFFSYMGRLIRGYVKATEEIMKEDLTLFDMAELIKTDFMQTIVQESLATANTFWGIGSVESITDMEFKEKELCEVLKIDTLYQIAPGKEGRWPVMTLDPKVIDASKKYLHWNNKDSNNQSQRSAGCPMRFHKMIIGDNPTIASLTAEQIQMIKMGYNPVGTIQNDKITLLRHPIKELSELFSSTLQTAERELL